MAAGSNSGDWRSHLTPHNRTRVYHKIMNCLMMTCQIGTPKELEELQKIAVQFERRMYTSATSKDDYVRKISSRLHCMEAHYQGTAAVNPSHPNPSVGDQSSTQSGTNDWSTSSLQASGNMDIKITERFSGAVESQEEIYQKINFMKELYLAELSELHQKLKSKVNQVKSMPSKVLNRTIGDMISVLSFMHNVASSDLENSCRVAVNEDLATMTECRLRAHKSGSQEKLVATKKMKREISAICGNDTDELESTETSAVKRKKVEAYHGLVEEISKINHQLIDTIVSIANEDGDSFAALTGTHGGVMVKFSFIAVSLSESFRSEFFSGQLSPIMPLRLLVPADYPKCSPVVLDKLKVDLSKESGLSVKAQMIFDASIRSLVQPVSLRELARTWDNSVYKVIREYAEQSGGGSFSSVYGAWESCVAV